MKKTILALALALAASAASAQVPAPALTRTVIDRADVPAGEAVQGKTEVPAGVSSGKHIHHGVELVYVIDGAIEFVVEGQPTRVLKAGDTVFIRREVPHEARGLGPGPTRLASSWIVDKDRPLAEPVK